MTCGCKLHHRYCHKHFKGGAVRNVKVHRVLFCANRSCGMSMNRDENAAANILKLFLQEVEKGTRPRHFSRGVQLEECIGAPFGEVIPVQPVHSGIISGH